MPNPGFAMQPQTKLPKNPNDCWPFLGALTPAGYGKKSVNGQQMSAGRWMWMTLLGPIPPKMVVAMTCGRRDCINPHHLRLTTQSDANRAGVAATLTSADVAEIRQHYETRTNHTAAHLAERYGVHARTIFDIWGGRSWARPLARAKRDAKAKAKQQARAQA